MNIYENNNIFNDSKYTRWYYNIVENAKKQERIKSDDNIFEKHHILPASLFPKLKNNKLNLVLLTPKEHFIVHTLLVKMTSGLNKSKMSFALYMFKMSPNKNYTRYINSNIHQKLTKHAKHTDEFKKWWHENIGPKFKGKGNPRYGVKLNDETKQLISKAQSKYMWINDGIKNCRHLKDLPIPLNFTQGRIMPWAKEAGKLSRS